MREIYLYSYVEDPPSAEIARRIVAHINRSPVLTLRFDFVDGFPSIERGFGRIKKKVPALVDMAVKGQHSFVIVDLDTTDCAPNLISEWFRRSGEFRPRLPAEFVFRVAVREIESWILADREALAAFLGIPIGNFPIRPDELLDPKNHLLNILRRKGRKKWHREMLPKGPTAAIGPMYNEKLCEFVRAMGSGTSKSKLPESVPRSEGI